MQKRSVFLLSFLVSFSQLMCMDLEPVTDDDDTDDGKYDIELSPANPSDSLSRQYLLSNHSLDLITRESDKNPLYAYLYNRKKRTQITDAQIMSIVTTFSPDCTDLAQLDPRRKTFCSWDNGIIKALNYETGNNITLSCPKPHCPVICSSITTKRSKVQATLAAITWMPSMTFTTRSTGQKCVVDSDSTEIKVWNASGEKKFFFSALQAQPQTALLSPDGSRCILLFDQSIEIFRTDKASAPSCLFTINQEDNNLKIQKDYLCFKKNREDIEIKLVSVRPNQRASKKVELRWNSRSKTYVPSSSLLIPVTEPEPFKYSYNPRKIKKAATVGDHTTAAIIDSLQAEHKRDNEQLQNTLNTTQEELNLARKAAHTLSTEKSQLAAQVDELEDKLAEATTAQSKLADLTAQLKAATSTTREQEQRVAELEEELRQAQAAQTELERAQTQLKAAQARVTELAKEKDETNSELINARAKVTELETRVSELQAQAARITELEANLADARRERDELRSSGATKAQIAGLHSALSELAVSQRAQAEKTIKQEQLLADKNEELAQLREELERATNELVSRDEKAQLLVDKERELKTKEDALRRQREEFKQEIAREAGQVDRERRELHEEVQQDQESWSAEVQARLQQQEDELQQRMDAFKALYESQLRTQQGNQQDELATKNAEIARLTTELDELRSGQSSVLDQNLRRREEELKQKESGFDKKLAQQEMWINQKVEERTLDRKNQLEDWATEREAELNTRETLLDQKNQRLTDLNDQLVALQNQLKDEDKNLEQQRAQTEEELNHQARGLDDREEVLDQRETELETKEADLVRREEELKKREESISARIIQANKTSGGVLGLQATLDRREETISNMQEQLASLSQQLEQHRSGVAASPATSETAQKIDELQQTIGQRDATITALETTLADKNATISHLEQQLTRLSRRLSELQQADEAAASPTSGSASDTDSVRSSNSATSPHSSTSSGHRKGRKKEANDRVKHPKQWR